MKKIKIKMFGMKVEIDEIDTRSLLICMLVLAVPVSLAAMKMGGF